MCRLFMMNLDYNMLDNNDLLFVSLLLMNTFFLFSLDSIPATDCNEDSTETDGQNDSNDKAYNSTGTSLRWGRLVNGILVVAIGVVVEVIAIPIIIDDQVCRRVVPVLVIIIGRPVVNIEWLGGTPKGNTVIAVCVRSRVLVRAVGILSI
jgi:hypothetical protein